MSPPESAPSPLQMWLDLGDERLWCDTQAIALRPKAFALLRYLVEHPEQLLTKDTLLEAIWPETTVSEVVLAVCILELRRALRDDPRAPRFIETVYRRGYRFIGTIPIKPGSQAKPPEDTPRAAKPLQTSRALLVGRETELHHLHRCLDESLSGRRQFLFVTGEAGLGKTALVSTFLEAINVDGSLWVGRGQCIEHYGVGEAYLPVLEALGRLCQASAGDDLVTLLAQRAPLWLVQMPWLLSASQLKALQHRVVGATRERMLREMAETIEEIAASQPLVLVFEDLHWSDYATLDLIATLARRQEPARLLLLGTYRPADVTRRNHPVHLVQQELHVHGLCGELPLTFLHETAIAAYLVARFPRVRLPRELARVVYQRCEGNPLFMVNMVAYWVEQGWLVERETGWTLDAELPTLQAGMPASLRQMIEMQLDRLHPEEQRVLEAGSVAGVEFSAAAVASGLAEDDVIRVDEQCADLVRRSQWLQACGEQAWPDGTVAGRYGFVHALYQEVLYSRLTAARRVYLHRQIGLRLEAGYRTQVGTIAAELARHSEQGRDVSRAVAYLQQAASNTLRRYANREAIEHLTKGLELLRTLPATRDRHQQELDLLLVLGPALTTLKGYGAREVEQTYTQARALCQHVGNPLQRFGVIRGFGAFYQQRGELRTTRTLAGQLLSLAQETQDPALLARAHLMQGSTLFYLGELAAAHQFLAQAMASHDLQSSHARAMHSGLHTSVVCQGHMAWTLWLLGYPHQALQQSHTAWALAQELSHPHSMVYALHFACAVHQFRGEIQTVRERSEAVLALATEQGFVFWLAYAMVMRGWALALQGQGKEGLTCLRQGLATQRQTGAELGRTYFLALLAEACEKMAQPTEEWRMLTQGLAAVAHTGESFYAAELHRLKGVLLLLQEDPKQRGADAEQCFQEALAIARHQQAKSLELRAAISLARLWQHQGKRAHAYKLLEPVYAWFTEGFDTADLQDAAALLSEVA